MSVTQKLVIFTSLLCLSLSAQAVKFENLANKNATFILQFKSRTGSQEVPLAAKESKEESIEEFLKKAPPATSLWIFVQQRKKAPRRDIYCSPTLTVKELSDAEKKWKVSFSGNKCEIVSE